VRVLRLIPRSDGPIAALLAASAVLLYEITSFGRPTSFDYYGRLARAFLDGRWWLTDAPAHLVELVPCGTERFCVAYPPMPAAIAVPFVLVFDTATAQTLASAVVGGLAAAPTYLALRAIDAPKPVAVLVTVFALFGTTLWFTASTGDAWFYAHAVAVLFTSIAVVGALRGWPAWSIGALIGAAALARLPVALALLPLALVARQRRGDPLPRALLSAAAGILPFVMLELGYDIARWGVPSEAGYAYLTATDNPVVPYGLFSLRYLPDHLFAIFARLPELGDPPFVLRPSRWGLSLILLSPALAFLVPGIRKLRAHPALGGLLAAGALALLPDLLHGGVGARQLGYRFSLDAQPFVLPLIAVGAAWHGGWRRPSRALLLAVATSVLVNAYAIAAIVSVGYA